MLAAATTADIAKALKVKDPKSEKELREYILLELYNILLLFFEREADKLAPYRGEFDYRIEIRR